MELTLLAPTVLSAACSKALAFWAAAGPTASPSTRADAATNVTSTFLISLLPKSMKDRKFGLSLSQVAAERCMQLAKVSSGDTGGLCGFLDVALGEQRGDRLFLLTPEFSA